MPIEGFRASSIEGFGSLLLPLDGVQATDISFRGIYISHEVPSQLFFGNRDSLSIFYCLRWFFYEKRALMSYFKKKEKKIGLILPTEDILMFYIAHREPSSDFHFKLRCPKVLFDLNFSNINRKPSVCDIEYMNASVGNIRPIRAVFWK